MKKLHSTILITFLTLASYAQGPNLEWAKQIGGSNSDVGRSIITDSNGNVYTLGNFEGTVDFDPGPAVQNLTSAGGTQDVFIQKLDASGNLLWVEQVTSVSGGTGRSITLDNNENICIAGSNDGIFVQKLDANGNLLWNKQMVGVSGGGTAASISTDDNGNIYTTGGFYGTIDFDPGPGVQNLTLLGSVYYTYGNMFIQKLDANGNFLWVRQRAGNNSPFSVDGYAIAADGNGDVYVLGNIIEINEGTVFVEKLDTNGNSLWLKEITGIPYLIGRSMTTDTIGNIYTTGSFSGTADFDPGPGIKDLTAVGDTDIFIQKLDPGGNFLWAKQIAAIEFVHSIVTDVSGNVYTTGFFEGTVDFDPDLGVQNLIAAAGTADMFIQKLDPAGDFLWVKQIVGSGYAVGNSITIDLNGSIYTTGAFDDTIDFDPGSGVQIATSAGDNDLFIHKLNPISTGIDTEENALTDKFVLYPNPTAGKFAIEFDKIQKHLTVRLFDVSGQLLMHQNFRQTNFIQLEINHPDGIYILEILDAGGNKAGVRLLKE